MDRRLNPVHIITLQLVISLCTIKSSTKKSMLREISLYKEKAKDEDYRSKIRENFCASESAV